MSYILAKQAGTNIRFAAYDSEIPESDIYLMPSVSGSCALSKAKYYELLERVKNGAALYISNDNAFLTDFAEVTGVKICDSRKSHAEGMCCGMRYERDTTCYIEPVGAKVLAAEDNGNPMLTVNEYSKGKVYYLNFPLEKMLLSEEDAFDRDYYKLYNEIFGTVSNPALGITDHGEYKVIINYTDKPQPRPEYEGFAPVYGGETVPPMGCTVLKREKK